MLPKVFKTKIIFKKAFFLCFCSAFITIFCYKVNAQGNLLVTPKRVVFEGSKRSEELNLANTGKDSATYEISFIQIRMKEDGSVENITEPDSSQLFADKYVRFFPRSVTLAPNEAQTVKVQVRRKDEMPPGEYRSHLYFRAVPAQLPLGEPDKKKDTTGISVRLVPIFGISMPVIVRMGESNVEVKMSDISLIKNDTLPVLKLTINRKGNMSAYGDIIAQHIASDGKVSQVGIAKGLAVYTPNSIRHFHLPLTKASRINLGSGKLQVVFYDQSAKATKLAEEFINLN